MNEKIYRTADVYFKDRLAGSLAETDRGYYFLYDENFIKTGRPISVSLPLRKEPFEAKELFSFFQGLIPEGWYLELVCKTQKIDRSDQFGLLLTTTTTDAIGAVVVRQRN